METKTADDVRRELHSIADPEKAKILQRFFKKGSSQYGGEGDTFIGVLCLHYHGHRHIAR